MTKASQDEKPNAVLSAWQLLDLESAACEVLPCCGSQAWAHALAAARPFSSVGILLDKSDVIWSQLRQTDWEEAFATHPRIGEKKAAANATAQSAEWSSQEQRAVANVTSEVLERLALGNVQYEQCFGRTYIVCATGKSAEQMLTLLEERLRNNDQQELREAVEQQRQITQIRLRKWLRL